MKKHAIAATLMLFPVNRKTIKKAKNRKSRFRKGSILLGSGNGRDIKAHKKSKKGGHGENSP